MRSRFTISRRISGRISTAVLIASHTKRRPLEVVRSEAQGQPSLAHPSIGVGQKEVLFGVRNPFRTGRLAAAADISSPARLSWLTDGISALLGAPLARQFTTWFSVAAGEGPVQQQTSMVCACLICALILSGRFFQCFEGEVF